MLGAQQVNLILKTKIKRNDSACQLEDNEKKGMGSRKGCLFQVGENCSSYWMAMNFLTCFYSDSINLMAGLRTNSFYSQITYNIYSDKTNTYKLSQDI